jgi:hypothetical protein
VPKTVSPAQKGKTQTENKPRPKASNSTIQGVKIKISIEIKQDYNGFMEITVIYPSFDYYNIKIEFLTHC